jgi:hypothetical protein
MITYDYKIIRFAQQRLYIPNWYLKHLFLIIYIIYLKCEYVLHLRHAL